jgi:hypothetical protein
MHCAAIAVCLAIILSVLPISLHARHPGLRWRLLMMVMLPFSVSAARLCLGNFQPTGVDS